MTAGPTSRLYIAKTKPRTKTPNHQEPKLQTTTETALHEVDGEHLRLSSEHYMHEAASTLHIHRDTENNRGRSTGWGATLDL